MPRLRGSTSARMVLPSRRVSASLSPARVDPGEHRCERGDSPFLDGRLVQEGGAEVGHLAGERAGARRACIIEDRRDLPAGELIDLVADGPAVPAGAG